MAYCIISSTGYYFWVSTTDILNIFFSIEFLWNIFTSHNILLVLFIRNYLIWQPFLPNQKNNHEGKLTFLTHHIIADSLNKVYSLISILLYLLTKLFFWVWPPIENDFLELTLNRWVNSQHKRFVFLIVKVGMKESSLTIYFIYVCVKWTHPPNRTIIGVSQDLSKRADGQWYYEDGSHWALSKSSTTLQHYYQGQTNADNLWMCAEKK